VHLSAEELSEVAEGRQEGAQGDVGPAPDVAEHLRDCAQCRDEADAMAELLAALADLEQPTIPQEVALRIDTALAEAALIDVPSPDASLEDGAPHMVPGQSSAPASVSTPSTAGSGTASGHSRGSRRPPSQLPRTRRPASRGSSSRRSLRRVAGWTLGSLVLVGGLAGLATVIGSQSGNSATSTSGEAAAGSGAARNPGLPYAMPNVDSAARSMLVTWTRHVLSTTAYSAGGSGSSLQKDSPSSIPTSSLAAASVSQCEANPAFADRRLVGATSGLFGTTPTVVVVYANGDGSQSVYAVAYAAPCASSDYRVLVQGTVPE
jgi:hypothetical protein